SPRLLRGLHLERRGRGLEPARGRRADDGAVTLAAGMVLEYGVSAMRIAVAELAQETDSFSPLRADLAEFESYGLFRGTEILERMRDAGPLGGLLELAEVHSGRVELVPLLRAWGGAG